MKVIAGCAAAYPAYDKELIIWWMRCRLSALRVEPGTL